MRTLKNFELGSGPNKKKKSVCKNGSGPKNLENF